MSDACPCAQATFVEGYLWPAHRDNTADGCAFAALAAEAARRSDLQLREVLEEQARGYPDTLGSMLDDQPGARSHDWALAMLSTVVGALLMSRVVIDPELSDEGARLRRQAVTEPFGSKGPGDVQRNPISLEKTRRSSRKTQH